MTSFGNDQSRRLPTKQEVREEMLYLYPEHLYPDYWRKVRLEDTLDRLDQIKITMRLDRIKEKLRQSGWRPSYTS